MSLSQYLKSCTSTVSPQLSRYPKTLIAVAGLVAGLTTTTTVRADVMLGASLPNDGFSRPVIADFNQQTPKGLAYVNVFSAFSHDWDNLYWQSSNVVSEGAMPMITWMPIDLSRRGDNLLPEIVMGSWDEYLTQWGTKLLAWVNSYPETSRPRLSIRFAHEFNGNWYPYSNTPMAYSAAWQHIHDMFGEMGVNQHVDWVWSASKTNVDDYNDFTVYYPGDNYVDWTSLDGYNWGSNYVSGGWSSFKNIFAEAYQTLVSNYPDKPIMIAETGSAEPRDTPNVQYGMYGDDSDLYESKTVWIANMLQTLETDFPAVRALSLFNIDKELGWSITTEESTGLDGYIAGVQSGHFTAEFLVASEQVLIGAAVTDSKSAKKAARSDKKNNRQMQRATDKALVASRNVSARDQARLAKNSRVKVKKDQKNEEFRVLMKNMSGQKKKAFGRHKMSVIDY